MLAYENKLNKYASLYKTCLYVVASGMPIHRLIANDISRVQANNRSSLVLLINCESYLDLITEHCQSKIVQISTEPSIVRRQERYFSGGVFSASLRTLVLDLLCIRLSPDIITEVIVVLNKHMLNKHSYLFVFLDFYLKENKEGAVRVYTDRPWQFDSLKVLKRLSLNHVLLLPRTHPEISEELGEGLANYMKMHDCPLQLTSENRVIYQAAIKLMRNCLDNIMFLAQKIGIDFSFLDVSKALVQDVTFAVETELGHRKFWGLPQRLKALLKDAENIGRLLRAITEYDTIGVYIVLYGITSENKEFSMFEYPDEETSEQLATILKINAEQIYSIVKGPVLDEEEEEKKYQLFEGKHEKLKEDKLLHGYSLQLKFGYADKLQALGQIVESLGKQREKELNGSKRFKVQHGSSTPKMVRRAPDEHGRKETVIICCKDEKERMEIENYLLAKFVSPENKDIGFLIKIKKYLSLKADFLRKNHILYEGSYGKIPEEKVREAALIENKLYEVLNTINAYYEEIYMGIQKKRERKELELGHELYDIPSIGITETEYFEADVQGFYDSQCVIKGSEVLVRAITNPVDFYWTLQKYLPRNLILYNLRLPQIRVIEDYCAVYKCNLDVYQLYYKYSIEDYRFVKFVAREKASFSHLMCLHEEEAIPLAVPLMNEPEPFPVVAVDFREFAGPLPAHLYSAGIRVIPLMLSVGDYVVSDDICIERKAVSTGDLFESIRSGRLLQQITRMCRHYKKPILLLEFDKTIEMQLYDTSEPIMKRLAILKANYPKVTIIWTQGAKDSVKVIMQLKEDKANLDLVRAERIGKNAGIAESPVREFLGTGEDQSKVNYSPLEFLRKIEGVTSEGLSEILKKVKNIYELATLPQKKLQEIAGEAEGEAIYRFLHEEVRDKPIASDMD